MKIKRVFLLLIAAVILLSATVFADGEEHIFTNFKLCHGTVWLLNDENNTVILQNVKTKTAFGREEIVPDLEYREIPVIPSNIFSFEGEPLGFEVVNAYLLDSRVSFVVASNDYGYRILYMEIQ